MPGPKGKFTELHLAGDIELKSMVPLATNGFRSVEREESKKVVFEGCP